MNTTQANQAFWKTSYADRISQLRRRVAFSTAFIADKSKPLEHRLAEKKALASWKKSLADLGAGE